MFHMAAATESAKKFDIFHQGHLGKTADIEKSRSPAKNAVVAAAHSQQNACVMSKAVR
jgi:glycerol-3-phosphate cytidylyltransferase-like family protein